MAETHDKDRTNSAEPAAKLPSMPETKLDARERTEEARLALENAASVAARTFDVLAREGSDAERQASVTIGCEEAARHLELVGEDDVDRTKLLGAASDAAQAIGSLLDFAVEHSLANSAAFGTTMVLLARMDAWMAQAGWRAPAFVKGASPTHAKLGVAEEKSSFKLTLRDAEDRAGVVLDELRAGKVKPGDPVDLGGVALHVHYASELLHEKDLSDPAVRGGFQPDVEAATARLDELATWLLTADGASVAQMTDVLAKLNARCASWSVCRQSGPAAPRPKANGDGTPAAPPIPDAELQSATGDTANDLTCIMETRINGVTGAERLASKEDPPHSNILGDVLIACAVVALSVVTEGIGTAISVKFLEKVNTNRGMPLVVAGAMTDLGITNSQQMVHEAIGEMVKNAFTESVDLTLGNKVKSIGQASSMSGEAALLDFFDRQRLAVVGISKQIADGFKDGIAARRSLFAQNPQAALSGLRAAKEALSEQAAAGADVSKKQEMSSITEWLACLAKTNLNAKDQTDQPTHLQSVVNRDNVKTKGDDCGAHVREQEAVGGVLMLNLGNISNPTVHIEHATIAGTNQYVRALFAEKQVRTLKLPITVVGWVHEPNGEGTLSLGRNEAGDLTYDAEGCARAWMLRKIGKEGQGGEAALREAATAFMDKDVGSLFLPDVENDIAAPTTCHGAYAGGQLQ